MELLPLSSSGSEVKRSLQYISAEPDISAELDISDISSWIGIDLITALTQGVENHRFSDTINAVVFEASEQGICR
jgi:hypothetical protein